MPKAVPQPKFQVTRLGQGDQPANSNDLLSGIIVANPSDGDILEGDDQSNQHQKADAYYVGTGVRYFWEINN